MISKEEARSNPLEQMRRDASAAAKRNNDPHFTVEEVAEALGQDSEEFLACMMVVQHMIEEPASYMGPKAAVEAVRLAALRTRIGMKAQMYKSASVGNAELRKRKDVLMTMYESLLENINCLKGLAKYEREL